ncbi:uncharacterized protein LOC124684503 [Lolium rigidum]|uniref:uncharacterized protein LOC124684503 n=1 Tax=Lolium rigidum TaxID=89674 RepID=UPI001F5DF31B|nr:uncharacterized protein LOC124684503 [Lolium rigidum]
MCHQVYGLMDSKLKLSSGSDEWQRIVPLHRHFPSLYLWISFVQQIGKDALHKDFGKKISTYDTKFGIKSWTLWLVSLAVELTSLGIHSDAIVLNYRVVKVHQLSSAERDEVGWFRFSVTTKLRKIINAST